MPSGEAPERVASAPSPPTERERGPAQLHPTQSQLGRTAFRWAMAGLFVIVGTAKLVGVPATVSLFDAVGFGQWFRYFVGTCELLGAALLAFPTTAPAGAIALGFVMVGAVGTEVFLLHRLPVSSVPVLVAVLILARMLRSPS